MAINYFQKINDQSIFRTKIQIDIAQNYIVKSLNNINEAKKVKERKEKAKKRAQELLWQQMPQKIVNKFYGKVMYIDPLTSSTCWAQISFDISNYSAVSLAESIGEYIKRTTGETPVVHVFKLRKHIAVARPGYSGGGYNGKLDIKNW